MKYDKQTDFQLDCESKAENCFAKNAALKSNLFVLYIVSRIYHLQAS